MHVCYKKGEAIEVVAPKKLTRREKALLWMQQQKAKDDKKAIKEFKEELDAIRKIDPNFTL